MTKLTSTTVRRLPRLVWPNVLHGEPNVETTEVWMRFMSPALCFRERTFLPPLPSLKLTIFREWAKGGGKTPVKAIFLTPFVGIALETDSNCWHLKPWMVGRLKCVSFLGVCQFSGAKWLLVSGSVNAPTNTIPTRNRGEHSSLTPITGGGWFWWGQATEGHDFSKAGRWPCHWGVDKPS